MKREKRKCGNANRQHSLLIIVNSPTNLVGFTNKAKSVTLSTFVEIFHRPNRILCHERKIYKKHKMKSSFNK